MWQSNNSWINNLFLVWGSLRFAPTKPLGCSTFLFACVWVMHTFKTMKYTFLRACKAYIVFSCKMTEKSTRKGDLKVCGEPLCLVGKWTHKPKLTCATRCFFALISCAGWFHNLMVCSHGCGKTYSSTHAHTHTFRETISGNQACAHSQQG